MQAYLKIVKEVLDNGILKENRTGVDTLTVPGAMFRHDMSEGFPLLTTKYIPFEVLAVELEGFIKGITDKKWFKERGCNIWNEWCNPTLVPYGNDDETKARMMEVDDLGPIYGYQWRNFGGSYSYRDNDWSPKGIDQLKNLVETLKTNPNDRRMIVSAWNPMDLYQMALPPCHYGFQVTVIGGKLNLLWDQRSVDVALGLPFNIASYGLLLELLAFETGLQSGDLIGFLGDTHIYENHIDGLKTQLEREPYKLPHLLLDFESIFYWEHDQAVICDYFHHKSIKFEVAV